jgi:hypothetical protein
MPCYSCGCYFNQFRSSRSSGGSVHLRNGRELCEDCAEAWDETQRLRGRAFGQCECGHPLASSLEFRCDACLLAVKKELHIEALRQNKIIVRMERDDSFLVYKEIGQGTYAAVIELLFGARIIVGQWDDPYGYEAFWDYTGDNALFWRDAAIEAFHQWTGRGQPRGYTRDGAQVSQSQASNAMWGSLE